jgi:hypothetical protein
MRMRMRYEKMRMRDEMRNKTRDEIRDERRE